MATQKAKEPPMAFMASSSGSMFPELDGVHVRKRQPSEAGRRVSEDLMSPTDTSGPLPIRQQIPSASKIVAEDGRYSPSDSDYWYHQYSQARTLINQMHDLWKRDTKGLLQRIADLEEALAKHVDCVPTNAGKENHAAAYGTPDIVKVSQEKLRALSNVSYTPPNLDGSSSVPISDDKTPTEGSKQTSFFPPQPSGTSPGPSVTFSTAILASIPETVHGLSVDDPPSPPTTAKIPTPPYLRTHAGHTPRIPIGELPEDDINQNHVRPGQYASFGASLAPSDPRMLPTKPKDSAALSSLDEKLQTVAADPDKSIPQALRSDDTGSVATERSPPPIDDPSSGVVNGVKLKKKQSFNFGAPLLQGVKITPRSPDNEQL